MANKRKETPFPDKSVLKSGACTLWTGCTVLMKGKYSYGITRWQNGRYYSHRLAYALAKGVKVSDLKTKVIKHKCGNTLCIDPEHMFEFVKEEVVNDNP